MWKMTQAWRPPLAKTVPQAPEPPGNYASGWNSDWGSFADRAAWVLVMLGLSSFDVVDLCCA